MKKKLEKSGAKHSKDIDDKKSHFLTKKCDKKTFTKIMNN